MGLVIIIASSIAGLASGAGISAIICYGMDKQIKERSLERQDRIRNYRIRTETI